MKPLILLIAGIFLLSPAYTQEKSRHKDYEVNAGFNMLIYQSVYSFQDSYGMEATVRGSITGPIDWQAGLRLGLNPALPEGFVRILGKQEAGAWRPEIGLELGITSRTYFEDGANLLRETREAMQTDINAVYMAIHTAPLAFSIKNKWKVSAMEIDFGTHFANFGRTLRAQVTFISVGRKF